MLNRIIQAKQAEVARLQQCFHVDHKSINACAINPENFRKGSSGLQVIAEIKKASPSKGLLCTEFDPLQLALAYQANGAAALSVLTETAYFQGRLEDLRVVKSAVRIPVLRKDFILDVVQIYESAMHGADIVLLIAALHPYPRLLTLCETCQEVGIQPLVEVHCQEELNMAVDLPVPFIGVNNRNLRDFTEDISVSLELCSRIPSPYIKISASSIRTIEDMMLMDQAGYDMVLIGEALVTAEHPGSRLGQLLDYKTQNLDKETQS